MTANAYTMQMKYLTGFLDLMPKLQRLDLSLGADETYEHVVGPDTANRQSRLDRVLNDAWKSCKQRIEHELLFDKCFRYVLEQWQAHGFELCLRLATYHYFLHVEDDGRTLAQHVTARTRVQETVVVRHRADVLRQGDVEVRIVDVDDESRFCVTEIDMIDFNDMCKRAWREPS
jgi:hypothetical protein